MCGGIKDRVWRMRIADSDTDIVWYSIFQAKVRLPSQNSQQMRVGNTYNSIAEIGRRKYTALSFLRYIRSYPVTILYNLYIRTYRRRVDKTIKRFVGGLLVSVRSRLVSSLLEYQVRRISSPTTPSHELSYRTVYETPTRTVVIYNGIANYLVVEGGRVIFIECTPVTIWQERRYFLSVCRLQLA